MISNPVKHFISSQREESFTHEGGSTLYHFSPHDNNLTQSMSCNVVFFANSEEHGLDILKRMLQFSIDCTAKYMAHINETQGVHWEEFSERAENKLHEYKSYIDAINAGKVKLKLAPMNQFYKVGWADNDTM